MTAGNGDERSGAISSSRPNSASAERQLDRAFVRAVSWKAALGLVTQGIKWLSTIFVARLLSPEDYGVVAAASVYIGFAALLTEFGIASAIIYQRDLTEKQIGQLGGVAILMGLATLAGSIVFALPVSKWLASEALVAVLPVMGIASAISVVNSVPVALLTRDLNFRTLSIIESTQALVSMVVVLGLALAGARYWSLVIGEVVGVVLMGGWLYRETRYSVFRPRLQELKSSLRFGGAILANRLAWYTYTNTDVAVVSRKLGAGAVGDYSMAWTLTTLPSTKIASFLLGVTPSLFARVQNDKKAMSRYYLKLTELLAICLFPAILGISLTARESVPLLLGTRWIGAVPIIQLLGASVALRSVMPLSNQVLVSRMRADLALRYSVLMALILPVGFWFGAQWGTTGVAAAWLTLYPILGLRQFQITSKELGISLTETLQVLVRPVGGLVVMTAAVSVARYSAPVHLPLSARLATLVLVGASVYGMYSWLMLRPQVMSLVQLVRNRKLD